MTDHAQERLYSRVKPYHRALAHQLVTLAVAHDSAALVSSVGKHTVSDSYRATGDASNGDNLVLIVRNGTPVTIMYCRTGQVTPAHLRVNEIIRL